MNHPNNTNILRASFVPRTVLEALHQSLILSSHGFCQKQTNKKYHCVTKTLPDEKTYILKDFE